MLPFLTMRPGLIFVGLFAVLTVVYFAAVDTLGALPTFALQALIVAALIVVLHIYRRTPRR